jgi:hypothetical protein
MVRCLLNGVLAPSRLAPPRASLRLWSSSLKGHLSPAAAAGEAGEEGRKLLEPLRAERTEVHIRAI